MATNLGMHHELVTAMRAERLREAERERRSQAVERQAAPRLEASFEMIARTFGRIMSVNHLEFQPGLARHVATLAVSLQR